MVKDGKQLEHFVSFVEQELVPKGFEVALNRKEFDGDGNQLAEFDIVVRGKVGTGEIAWLIECRDRPSEGAAPGSWIEQLAGRRTRFNFNKVTAVSTSGFSPSARDSAAKADIELREVNSIAPEEFKWLGLEHLTFNEKAHNLRNATLNVVAEQLTPEVEQDLRTLLASATNQTQLLINAAGKRASLLDIFFGVTEKLGLWKPIKAGADPVPVQLVANFNSDDRFHVETSSHGNVEIGSIELDGEIFLRETLIPPTTYKYEGADGAVISEIVTFPVVIAQTPIAVEIHKISGASEMPVILRKLGKDQDG
jgi:hypothetical protein